MLYCKCRQSRALQRYEKLKKRERGREREQEIQKITENGQNKTKQPK